MVGKCRSGGIRVIVNKNKENLKLTYITPDWSPIDRIVVPNNRVNTQEKALKSYPCQVEVYANIPS